MTDGRKSSSLSVGETMQMVRHGLVMAVLLLGSVAQAQTPSFARDIDDLPIMSGLSDTDEGYVFQAASGARLAEVRLRGTAPTARIERYYQQTLPSLGWTAINGHTRRYQRGNEILQLMFGTASDGATVVRVIVTPR